MSLVELAVPPGEPRAVAATGTVLDWLASRRRLRAIRRGSHAAAWGLHEHWLATGDQRSRGAARRTAELFLEHRVFRALATGEPMHRSIVTLHYPPYWHYDVL